LRIKEGEGLKTGGDSKKKRFIINDRLHDIMAKEKCAEK